LFCWFRHPPIIAPIAVQRQAPLTERLRCAIGFGLFPADVRAFKGHTAFHRVPERWEF
jgi:hypothetical protein